MTISNDIPPIRENAPVLKERGLFNRFWLHLLGRVRDVIFQTVESVNTLEENQIYPALNRYNDNYVYANGVTPFDDLSYDGNAFYVHTSQNVLQRTYEPFPGAYVTDFLINCRSIGLFQFVSNNSGNCLYEQTSQAQAITRTATASSSDEVLSFSIVKTFQTSGALTLFGNISADRISAQSGFYFWNDFYANVSAGQAQSLVSHVSLNESFLVLNAYKGTDGFWKYKTSATALMYEQRSDGTHLFYKADSGSANSNINWDKTFEVSSEGYIKFDPVDSTASPETVVVNGKVSRVNAVSVSSNVLFIDNFALGSSFQNGTEFTLYITTQASSVTVDTISVRFGTGGSDYVVCNMLGATIPANSLRKVEVHYFNSSTAYATITQ